MIYVVLGMHKSGTTLMAEMLHKSGINMVDESNYDSNLSYRNLKGKMERQSIVELNHQFLNSKEISSLDLHISPAKLEKVGTSLEKKIKATIEHCQNKYETWGFKDPRTCLTYPIWQKHLPDHKIIIVYRSPENVIHHYSKYFSFHKKHLFLYKALVKYTLYNRKLIELIEDAQIPCLIVSYEQFLNEGSGIDELSEFIGIPAFDARKQTDGNKKKQNKKLFQILNFITGHKATDAYDQLEKLRCKKENQVDEID